MSMCYLEVVSCNIPECGQAGMMWAQLAVRFGQPWGALQPVSLVRDRLLSFRITIDLLQLFLLLAYLPFFSCVEAFIQESGKGRWSAAKLSIDLSGKFLVTKGKD